MELVRGRTVAAGGRVGLPRAVRDVTSAGLLADVLGGEGGEGGREGGGREEGGDEEREDG